MKTMRRFSVQPLLPRLFFQPVFWIWATILLSILVTGSVSWLRFRQQQAFQLATTKLESIRLARIDLSKGFLYTTLPQSPDSPFNQDQGLALLQQGITTLDQTLIDLGPEALELAGSFRTSVNTFQNTLTDWNMAPIPLPGQTTKLRIAFFDLESQADLVDMQTQQSLNRLSVRLDTEFVVALAISAFMLAGICGIVFLSSRARRDSEAAQRESEERFRAIIENSAAGYFRIGVDERFQYVNNAWLKMHGYSSADEIIGKHFSVTHVEADLERSKRVVASTLIGESIPPDEFTRRCKDGTTGYHTFSVNPVRQGGKIIGLEGFLVDITERKHAEEALHLSEERFKAIASNTPDHILIQDLLLKYTFVINPQLGLTEEDMIGKTDYDFLPKEEADQLTQIKTQVLESGKPMQFETSLISKSGKPEYFDGIYMPKFDVGGRVDGLIGYFRNVTEHKLAEEKVAASQKFLQDFTDNSTSPIYALDSAGRFLLINRSLESLLGVPRETLIGKTREEILPPEVAAAHRANDLKVIEERRPITFEEEINQPDGNHTYISVKFPFFDLSGNLYGIGGISSDITERVLVEEKLQQSEHNLAEAERISHTGSWVYDVASDTASWSENMFRIFDVDPAIPKELVFRHFVENLVHPSDQEKVLSVFQDALAGKKPYDLEYRIIKRNGSIRDVHALAETVRDENGKAVRLIGKAEDITERKQAEEKAAEQMEELRRWYDATLGRETRVLELKREVNKLLEEAGLPPRYSSTDEENS